MYRRNPPHEDPHNTENVRILTEGAFRNPLYPREWVFMEGDIPLAGIVLAEIGTTDMTVSTEGRKLNLEAKEREGRIYLNELRAMSKGGGRKAMNILTERADNLGLTIDLFAQPRRAGYYLKPLTLRKLVAWYKGFGFKLEGTMRDGFMVRSPRGR